MNLFFMLPIPVRERCFTADDLALIRARHHVVADGYHDLDELTEQWARHAGATEGVVTGWDTPPLTDAMLDEAPRLGVLLHAAGSVKSLLPPSLWQRGVRVGTANEALAIGVAETTLGLIIASLKGFIPMSRLTRRGGWKQGDYGTPGFEVRELYNTTIGIIGFGKVGQHVLRLLRQFEVKVLLHDPTVDKAEAAALGVEPVSLHTLMRRSDVVTLHAPAIRSTRHMLGPTEFGLMRDQAIFINTARGSIVDEAALIDELRTGRIWAFLDVTDPEPPTVDHPFRSLPNVVLLPHIAGAISNGCFRLGRWVVEQLAELEEVRPMRGEVTQDQMTIMA